VRVIFSRKGFDSATGGCASPIINGRPVSLPIPTRMPSAVTFGDLSGDIGTVVRDLTKGRHTANHACHLDPDLEAAALHRHPGWRGAFGQVEHSQSHLSNQGVSTGDLFLFWGLFRPARKVQRWEYVGPREHRIFGWLQVQEVIRAGANGSDVARSTPWLADHPHARDGWHASNTIYTAAPVLKLRQPVDGVAGWGRFNRGLRLTALRSQKVSTWLVPAWLNPACGGVGMTFHDRPERWSTSGTVTTVGRGQEFVADIGERADALDWLEQLFEDDR
jgi:hypothetical protein